MGKNDFERLNSSSEKKRNDFVANPICFISYDNSKIYYESWKNLGAMVIMYSGLETFRSQNTKDSKNDMKLQYRL